MMNWIVEENYLFGCKEGFVINNDEKLYLFDLDQTLIKTASNKRFPINKDDWELIDDSVAEHLRGKQVGIISNQRGKNVQNDWMQKINDISEKININFAFCALKYDLMSKPSPNSYMLIKRLLKIKVPRSETFFIGDACGRSGDFSDTDYKYALNNEFNFLSPNKFLFGEDPEEPKTKYFNLEYYTNTEFEKIFKKIKKILVDERVVIVMVGYPSSGKSFLRRKIMDFDDDYYYCNNDDSKVKLNDNKLMKISKIHNKDKIINDNTNLSLKKREEFLSKFDVDYVKLCIHFDYDVEMCYAHLNFLRAYNENSQVLSKLVYNKMNAGYVEPGNEFDKIITISKLFPDMRTNLFFS